MGFQIKQLQKVVYCYLLKSERNNIMKQVCTVLLLFFSIVVAELFCAELFCMKEGESLVDNEARRKEYERIYQKVSKRPKEDKLEKFVNTEIPLDLDIKQAKLILDAMFDAILDQTNKVATK